MFGTFQIKIFSNFPNLKFLELSKLENKEISRFFSIWKIKIRLQKLAILKLFVLSIFRTTCNFENSHICPLFLSFDINQFRRFNLSTLISYSSGNFLDWKIHNIIKFLQLFNFENYQICKTWQFDNYRNFKNFQICKLSYILSVRTIQTDVKIRNKFENKKIE